MISGVVPPQKGVEDHLQAQFHSARYGQVLREEYSIWNHQLGGVGYIRGPDPAHDDLILVNAVLQHLPRGGNVLTQAELVDPLTQVVPIVEAEAEG